MKKYIFCLCLVSLRLLSIAQSFPGVSISDYVIRTLPDENYQNFVLQIDPQFTVDEEKSFARYKVRVELQEMNINVVSNADSILSVPVPAPRKWTAETPELYRLKLSLEDSAGVVLEEIKPRIGFRSMDVKENALLVNGKKVLLYGVKYGYNRKHESTNAEKRMVRDILLMKQANINAVISNYYSNATRWYELCDSMGLYVVDEVNSKYRMTSLSDKSDRSADFMNGVIQMVERDKNHPCVIMWSIGDNKAYKPDVAAASSWLMTFDPTRAVIYNASDTSNNTFSRFWSGFTYRLRDLIPDTRPTSKYLEVRKNFAPVELSLRGRELYVTNRNFHTDLSRYRCLYQLSVNGQQLLTGEFTIPEVKPGKTGVIKLPLWGGFPSGKDVRLRVSVVLRNHTSWAKRGYEVAWQQFCLQQGALPQETERYRNKLYTQVSDSLFKITSRRFGATWDAKEGNLISLLFDDKDVLSHSPDLPPQPATRPFVSDSVSITPRSFTHQMLDDGSVLIEISKSMHYKESVTDIQYQYIVSEKGEIDMYVSYTPSTPFTGLSHFGLSFYLDSSYDTFTWYGRGPQDTNPESPEYADMGRWSVKVDEQQIGNTCPLYMGNKDEIQYLTLTNSRGRGLKVQAIGHPFSASVLHNTISDLYKASQTGYEVTPRQQVILNINTSEVHTGDKTASLHIRLSRK